MDAYAQALAEAPPGRSAQAHRRRHASAPWSSAISSAAFHNLAPASQPQYRRFSRAAPGPRRQAHRQLERRHVVPMLDAKAGTPVAARDFLRCLRLLIAYAIKIGMRADDPAAGVRVSCRGPRASAPGPRRTSPPSRPPTRLAASRGSRWRCCSAPPARADVVRVGRGNVRNGVVTITSARPEARSRSRSPPPWPRRSTPPPRATPWCSWSTSTARRSPRRASASGSRRSASASACAACRRTACARRHAAGSRRSDARPTRSPPSAATPACARSSATPRRPTRARMARNAVARTEGQHRLSNPPVATVQPGKKGR